MYIRISSFLISREDVDLVLNILVKILVLIFFTCSVKKYALPMHICFQKANTEINMYLPKSAVDSMFLGLISKKKSKECHLTGEIFHYNQLHNSK